MMLKLLPINELTFSGLPFIETGLICPVFKMSLDKDTCEQSRQPVCRSSKSLLIFTRNSIGITWKYLAAFVFQVLASHLEEIYSEECKPNLEIHLEQFASASDLTFIFS